jgi:hypothetical protein
VVPTAYGDTPSLVIVATEQLSVAVVAPNNTALDEHNPASALMVTSAAHAVITGNSLSVTVTN